MHEPPRAISARVCAAPLTSAVQLLVLTARLAARRSGAKAHHHATPFSVAAVQPSATRGARRGAVCARLVADIAPLGAALCWSALRRAQPPSSLQHSKSRSAASQGCVEPLDTCNLRTSFHPVCPILLIHPNSNLAGQRQARAESPCRSCQERSLHLLYLGACTHSLHALCVSHGVSSPVCHPAPFIAL